MLRWKRSWPDLSEDLPFDVMPVSNGDWPEVRSDGTIRGFGAGELDPIANLSRYHYLKELYLDSATNMCVLSAVPSSPDNQPLPILEAVETVETVNALAGGTQRCVLHAFVMPNRGAY